MNYCYYIFGLRLPFGLRFDLQSHPPNRLIKFLFVGSRTLLHHFLHPYDYLKHDEITDPSYGIEKMDYIDEVNGQLGEKGARDINEILEANRALFAGGELDEEAKDAFYQAVTKAYLSCKMEAKKTFGRKKKNTEMESDS